MPPAPPDTPDDSPNLPPSWDGDQPGGGAIRSTSTSSERLGGAGSATASHRESAKPAEARPSVISQGITMEGNLHSAGSLHLEGTFIGSLECPELVVGADGAVDGEIRSQEMRLEGEASGSVRSGSVVMGPAAVFDGDLVCRSLSLAAGARLTGDVRVE